MYHFLVCFINVLVYIQLITPTAQILMIYFTRNWLYLLEIVMRVLLDDKNCLLQKLMTVIRQHFFDETSLG